MQCSEFWTIDGPAWIWLARALDLRFRRKQRCTRFQDVHTALSALQIRPEQRWIHPAFAWTSLFGRAVALDEMRLDPRLAESTDSPRAGMRSQNGHSFVWIGKRAVNNYSLRLGLSPPALNLVRCGFFVPLRSSACSGQGPSARAALDVLLA